ncbi:MAG: type II secretion system F family protein, partial [Planctomycetota bacterium]
RWFGLPLVSRYNGPMKSGDAQHSTLADELRTAAIELTRGAGRRGIEQMAAQVERGKSLESALQDTGCRLPTYYRQAILASVKTGDLPLCLTELARYDRVRRHLGGHLWVPLAFAGGHLLFFILALVVFGTVLGDAFQRVFDDFDMVLPAMTEETLWFATEGVKKLLPVSLLLVGGLLLGRLLLGRAGWRLFLYSIPGIGPLIRWLGTWQLLNLVNLLVARAVPLPEAFLTAADGVTDANVAATARQIAEQLTKGSSLSRELAETSRLSRSTVPLIRWGEEQHQLEAALSQASDLLEGRMAMQAAWLRTVIPPMATVLSGGVALIMATAAMLPLVSLIQNLS